MLGSRFSRGRSTPTPPNPEPWRVKGQPSRQGPEIHVQIWRTETKSRLDYFHTETH